VLLAVCQEFDIKNEIIPRIASCFGGGIGNTGSVCGAVIGAVMAIGLMNQRGQSLEDWLRVAAIAQEFRKRFEAEMETIICQELTGADFTTEEGREQFMNSDVPQTVCITAVGLAYRLVMDLLKENS
jgi:C_GCAxxG_C_C family probable redox protein